MLSLPQHLTFLPSTAHRSPVIATICIDEALNQPYKQQFTGYSVPCNQNSLLYFVVSVKSSTRSPGS